MRPTRRCTHSLADGSTCGAIFEAYPSSHLVNCPEHRRGSGNCRIKKDYTIQGTCSECGNLYSCDGKQYRHKRKVGKPTLCHKCITKKQSISVIKNNLERKTYRDAPKEWMAPCRMRIVPKRAGMESRCKPALAGRCHMVEQCVNFAAKAGWDGWKVRNL